MLFKNPTKSISNHFRQPLKKPSLGFTLVELMIGIGIAGILVMIAMPNLTTFLVQNRADNGVLEFHRLVLSARNAAISSGNSVTLCPLSASQQCTANWDEEITVFIDLNNDQIYQPASDERIIKVRNSINSADNIQTTVSQLVYAPTGSLTGTNSNIEFRYCTNNPDVSARAVTIATTGRPSISGDRNGDGTDEDRNGANITCSP